MKKLILITIALILIMILVSGCFSGFQMGGARREIDEMHREIGALRSELNAVQNDLDKARETIAELTLQIEAQKNFSSSMRQIFPPRDCGELEPENPAPDCRTFEITLPTRDQVIDGFADSFWYIIDFSNDLSTGIRERQEERQNDS